MSLPIRSLTDPPAENLISEGVAWIQDAALGSAATIVAVVAVAAIGLFMLSGRLELRRGITVVIGCFILFGAGSIAAALTGLVGGDPMSTPSSQSAAPPKPPPPFARPPAAYDPYAGASVPHSR